MCDDQLKCAITAQKKAFDVPIAKADFIEGMAKGMAVLERERPGLERRAPVATRTGEEEER